MVLAVCSGLGFAACSTAVKLVDLSHPLTALTSAPALVAALTGALGCLWWTLALRHTTVTTATAVVVVAEVVPPSLLAPLLGDSVSSWFALVAPIALGLAATACVVLARGGGRPARARPRPRRGGAPRCRSRRRLDGRRPQGGAMAGIAGKRTVVEPGEPAATSPSGSGCTVPNSSGPSAPRWTGCATPSCAPSTRATASGWVIR